MKNQRAKIKEQKSRLKMSRYFFVSFLLFVLCSLLSFSTSHAAQTSTTFTESLITTGVIDNTPPSTPTDLTATAVSQSEIDLSWNASTDNVAVGGYVLFRDGSAIATTTSTNFADTLLTASTTYSYNVQAFDTSYNYSALSSTTSTTTLPIPPTPPTTTPSAGGVSSSGSSLIYQVNANADSSNAVISFLTTLPAESTLLWGLTPECEAGSIDSVIYDTSHQVTVSSLSPDTNYYVCITAAAANGSQSSYTTEFTTAGLPGSPLPNPSNFTAAPTSNSINLSWTNTTDPRATEVRIVRSTTFYPFDQNDGVPVFEGAASSFVDTSVKAGATYYYAIFSEGVSSTGGQIFSSGVLASARISLPGQPVSFSTSTNPFAGITFATSTNPVIAGLALSDFQFIQEDKQLAIAGNNIVGVNGLENMTIRLPYDKVPQILKTIAVTLNDPTDPSKAFIFLLRANTDDTYYEASIGPLDQTAIFPMTVTILDYQNQGLKQLSGSLAALVVGAYQPSSGFNANWLWLGLLILVVLIITVVLWSKNRRRDINASSGSKLSILGSRRNVFASRSLSDAFASSEMPADSKVPSPRASSFSSLLLVVATASLFSIFNFQFSIARAAYNPEINYQGKLANASNVAVADGQYPISFSLYTTPTGGSPIWTEQDYGANQVTVKNGLFSVMLGSTTPLSGIDFDQTLYLGVTVASDTEMTPRKIIGAVPAAFYAATSTYATTAATSTYAYTSATSTYAVNAATSTYATTAGTSTYATSALNAQTLQNITPGQFFRNDQQNATSSASTFLNIMQNGAGKIAEFFGAAGQSVLSVLSNGNVGIGSSTPSTALVVNGTATVGNIISTTTATSTFVGGITANCFSVNGGACLSSSGGSGTVTSIATNNGLTGGTITASGTIGLDTTNLFANALVGWNGSTLTATGTQGLTVSNVVSTTTATSTFAGGITGPNGFTVQGVSGFVGIGKSNPSHTLDILSGGSPAFTIADSRTLNVYEKTTSIPGGADNDANLNVNEISLGSNDANSFYVGSRSIAGLANSRNVGIMIGNEGQAQNVTTGTISNIAAGVLGQVVNSSTGSITNASALYAENLYNSSGVTTNSYGLYIEPMTGALNNYEIYASSTAPFLVTGSGNVGIGTTTPSNALEVVGNGFFSGNITGTNLTATGTLNVSGQTTLANASTTNLSVSNNLSVLNNLTANSLTLSSITGTTSCLEVDSSGVVTGTGSSCGSGGGGGSVSSVSNSDGTLTISPTIGSVTASLNLAHANTWTALQTFGGLMSTASSTITSLTTTNSTSTNATTTNLAITGLSNAFLAVNNLGQVVGTTTPSYTNYFTNSGATTTLTTGNILAASTGNFGLINATSTTGTSTLAGNLSVGGDVTLGTGNIFWNDQGPIVLANSGGYFFGGAGNQTMTGGENTAIGSLALLSNASGSENTALGNEALQNNTGGIDNTAVGAYALFNNITGRDNNAVGLYSLNDNTIGSYNVANGSGALNFNTTGSDNSAQGYDALFSNTTGTDNSAQGENSLNSNTTGTDNSAQGYNALFPNTTGSYNVGVGSNAGSGSAIGAFNADVFVGADTGYNADTVQASTTMLGYQAGYSSGGNANTLLGYQSGYDLSTGSYNIAIGQNVDLASSTASGQLNIGNLIYGTSLYSGSSPSSVPSRGKVGIGTTTPSNALEVAGNGFFSGNLTGANLTATGTLNVNGQTTLANASTTNLSATGNLTAASASITSTTTTGGLSIGSLSGLLFGSSGSVNALANGTNGYVLQSTGSGEQWVATSSLGISGGGTNYFSNSGATTTLTIGSSLLASIGSFGTVNATSTTSTSTFAGPLSVGSTSQPVAFGVNGITGFIGIGTSSPFAQLSVQGYAGGTSPLFAIATTTSGGAGLPTTVFQIDQNGILTMTTPATSTITGNLYVHGALRSTTSYNGDLVFANGFRFTEASTTASTTPDGVNGLYLKNGSGDDLLSVDNSGNLTVTGDVCANGGQCYGRSIEDLNNDLNALASSTESSSAAASSTVLSLLNAQSSTNMSLSQLNAALINSDQVLSGISSQLNILSASTTEALNDISTMSASTTFMDGIASSTATNLATSTSFIQTIASVVENTIQSAGNWTVQKITASFAVFTHIETQTASVTDGLEMTDQATGQIYCVQIKSGDFTKTLGACSAASSTPETSTTMSATKTTTMITIPQTTNEAGQTIYNHQTPMITTDGGQTGTSLQGSTSTEATSTPVVATSTISAGSTVGSSISATTSTSTIIDGSTLNLASTTASTASTSSDDSQNVASSTISALIPATTTPTTSQAPTQTVTSNTQSQIGSSSGAFVSSASTTSSQTTTTVISVPAPAPAPASPSTSSGTSGSDSEGVDSANGSSTNP